MSSPTCNSFFFFFNVYLFWRERDRQADKQTDSVSGGGTEKEGVTESMYCEIVTGAEVSGLTSCATQVLLTCSSKEKATQDSVRDPRHVGMADQQGWNSFQAQCGRNVVILSDHFLPVHMTVSSFCN